MSQTKRDDEIVLLGDFNARVGTDAAVLEGVISRNGIGGMNNSSGLRLLTYWAKHNLTITNIIFRMINCLKNLWLQPRSKHWHLNDLVIVRRTDLRGVRKTTAIQNAECSTDHRLIASDLV